MGSRHLRQQESVVHVDREVNAALSVVLDSERGVFVELVTPFRLPYLAHRRQSEARGTRLPVCALHLARLAARRWWRVVFRVALEFEFRDEGTFRSIRIFLSLDICYRDADRCPDSNCRILRYVETGSK